MLEQLKEQQSTADRHFRDDLMRMLYFMRIAQLMITVFQQNTLVKGDKNYKPMRRFSQEVFGKLEWFQTVVKKIAGEHAHLIDEQLDFDNDKLQSIADAADFIANSKVDLSNAVDLMTNNTRRREIMFSFWKQSRYSLSPKMVLDEEEFDKWYDQTFG